MESRVSKALRIENELPSRFAERVGIDYANHVGLEHKKTNGQFFTPIEIADLMADLVDADGEHLSILDPGCGTAILSCSLIESLARRNDNLKSIELTLFEIDGELVPFIKNVMTSLKNWLLISHNISFSYLLKQEDFALSNAQYLDSNHNLFFGTPEDMTS
jgi:adenine-specific DNA-methyltransferase